MIRNALRLACGLCLVLGAGCKSPKPAATDEGGADAGGEEESEASPSGLSDSPMGAMASMLAKGLDEPGPYDAPKSSPDFDAEAPHWLALELDGPMVELVALSLLGGATGTPLRKVSDALTEAAANPAIYGLVLRIGGVSMSMAQAEELHAHMLAFKGKALDRKIVCHSEGLSNISTYLASACDEISLAPLGGLMIPGPAASPVHIKGLLDKLGITADFIHVGAFKSGPEPLTHTAPSKESLEVTQSLIDGVYARMVDGIAAGRGLKKDVVIAAVDQAMFVSETAKEAGLIDQIETYEAFLARTTEGQPWTRLKLGGGPKFDDPLALQRFLGILPPDLPSEPHVAVVYAVGNVVDGTSGGILGASGEIASRPLSAALRALAADDKVAAVVLRVDSPGGSALASEQIHLATLELADKKPLVVSMGSLAASGGYYISAAATKIYAQPDTLTGSIGVFGGKLAIGGALESIGINTYSVTRGKRGMMWSTIDVWTEDERELVREMMQQTYDRFLDRVASGRKMKRAQVHEIAQGRVWTGTQAKEVGLVDELGGLDDAIATAALLGEVELSAGLEFYPPEPNLKDLLGSLGSSGSPLGVHMSDHEHLLAQVLSGFDPDLVASVNAQLSMVFALQGAHVWAASFVPAPR